MAASAKEEADLDRAVRERCTKQLVQTVVMKLKYLSSHPATDRYTAGNATRNINQRDNIFIGIVNCSIFSVFKLSFSITQYMFCLN